MPFNKLSFMDFISSSDGHYIMYVFVFVSVSVCCIHTVCTLILKNKRCERDDCEIGKALTKNRKQAAVWDKQQAQTLT